MTGSHWGRGVDRACDTVLMLPAIMKENTKTGISKRYALKIEVKGADFDCSFGCKTTVNIDVSGDFLNNCRPFSSISWLICYQNQDGITIPIFIAIPST